MGNTVPPPPQLSEEEERSVVDYDVSVKAIASLIRAAACSEPVNCVTTTSSIIVGCCSYGGS